MLSADDITTVVRVSVEGFSIVGNGGFMVTVIVGRLYPKRTMTVLIKVLALLRVVLIETAY